MSILLNGFECVNTFFDSNGNLGPETSKSEVRKILRRRRKQVLNINEAVGNKDEEGQTSTKKKDLLSVSLPKLIETEDDYSTASKILTLMSFTI